MPQRRQNREVLLNDVLALLRLRPDGVTVSEYRNAACGSRRLGAVEPDHAIGERDARPDRRLDQALQIERDVVVLVPQIRRRMRDTRSSPPNEIASGVSKLRRRAR